MPVFLCSYVCVQVVAQWNVHVTEYLRDIANNLQDSFGHVMCSYFNPWASF